MISEPAESSCGSSVVLRNQTLTVANTNSAGTRCSNVLLQERHCLILSDINTSLLWNIKHTQYLLHFEHFSERRTHAHLLTCFSALSVFPGRAELAGSGAEVGRDPGGEGGEGKERNSYSLRRGGNVFVMISH